MINKVEDLDNEINLLDSIEETVRLLCNKYVNLTS